MNKKLSDSGRQILRDLLTQCTVPQQNIFKRIWARGRSEAELLSVTLDEIVNTVPDDRIDSSINLCERTVAKNNQINPGDFVHYIPTRENGRVKTIGEFSGFVVYKCNEEWDRYEDYTGQYTDIKDLRKGWVDKEGNQIDIPKME